jgi:ABC-type branched-subunit amino acid transport system ATPase component
VLEVFELSKSFGGVRAVDGVTFSVAQGESLGVIGPNGAGKSTFVGLVSGALSATTGTVKLDGTDVTKLDASARTARGVGRTHQIPRPFGGMTVLENVVLAARHSPTKESMAATRSRSRDILDRMGLGDVADTRAGTLPLLRRKRLEMARAFALEPRVLLLDEIGAGLVEHEVAELIELIVSIRADVPALVVIEHVMDVITACCDRTTVLDFGKVIAQGPTADVLADPNVAAIYLGTGTAGAQVNRSTTHADSPVILEVKDAEVSYGGVRALRGVSLELREGEVLALLGANGAGKTTLARSISAAVPLQAGAVHFRGQRIDTLTPDRVADAGVAHCMEGRRIFSTLSVEENLLLGADRATKDVRRERLARVYDMFPDLVDHRRRPGTAMSGGQQQMLAIGRALMADPKVLILDEVSLGLSPIAVDRLYESLEAIRKDGVALLLVEQNLERGLSLADRGAVIAHGRVVLTGTPAELLGHPSLTALYVGESVEEAS